MKQITEKNIILMFDSIGRASQESQIKKDKTFSASDLGMEVNELGEGEIDEIETN